MDFGNGSAVRVVGWEQDSGDSEDEAGSCYTYLSFPTDKGHGIAASILFKPVAIVKSKEEAVLLVSRLKEEIPQSQWVTEEYPGGFWWIKDVICLPIREQDYARKLPDLPVVEKAEDFDLEHLRSQ